MELSKELSEHVEKLTHTGLKILDPVLLKKVNKICRLSEKYIDHAYHLIMHELNKEHAEIRYSAFQLCDQLFRRSHHFRERVISDMRHLMDITTETDPERPLPLPRNVALDLKRFALQTIQEWNEEFGVGYKKLQIGFNFLKHCKKVDFNQIHNENMAEHARAAERERRQNSVNQDRLKKVNHEINDMEQDIRSTVTAMQNCISLLLPTPEDFFILDENDDDINWHIASLPSTSYQVSKENHKSSSDEEEEEEEEVNIRENGIINKNQMVQVKFDLNVKKIVENEANSSIIENARDLFRQLNNQLPIIKKWIQVISKASGVSDQLKKIMDLKQLSEIALHKYHLLKLDVKSPERDGDSSDSDLEEVPEKEGYEESVKEDLLSAMICESTRPSKEKIPTWSISSEENSVKDPTTQQCTMTSLTTTSKPVLKVPQSRLSCKAPQESMPSTSTCNSRKSKLLAVAPKLPFDIDLYHWEDEKVAAPTMLAQFSEGAQFWSARPVDGMEEGLPVPDGAASLRTRVIEFSGEFKEVKWTCRAPLDNGKLCPRRDRLKCPFHGKIVPRTETGKCSREADNLREQEQTSNEQAKNPDWQDPQLLAEIKASTGIDLTMPVKGKRSRAKVDKYPGLTKIKEKADTSHSRLSKKVFKKSAIKRISKAMDAMDHKRFRDKYGDQFHYMYNTA